MTAVIPAPTSTPSRRLAVSRSKIRFIRLPAAASRPDDIICILAGLTDISFPRFLAIVLLTRPWGLLVASAVGSSVISIPLWAMALIGLAGLALFLVSMKYGDRWEARLLEKFKQ